MIERSKFDIEYSVCYAPNLPDPFLKTYESGRLAESWNGCLHVLRLPLHWSTRPVVVLTESYAFISYSACRSKAGTSPPSVCLVS